MRFPRFAGGLILLFKALLLLDLAALVASRYNDAECCNLAREENAFFSPPSSIICGQQYNSSLSPAESLMVPVSFCKSKCSGFGLSQAGKPDQWAAPIVQFILPAVIFSMNIPRRHTILPNLNEQLFSLSPMNAARCIRLWWYSIKFIVSLISVILMALDTIMWVSAILALAGPMIVSSLREMLVDVQVVKDAEKEILSARCASQLENNNDTIDLIVQSTICVAAGNLDLDYGNAMGAILSETKRLSDQKKFKTLAEKVRALVTTQQGFGSTIAVPVVFYLGAFIYTIIDLQNNPSDQNAALSLAYGVEWMIVVHVAIVACCPLAANNPSTVESLAAEEESHGQASVPVQHEESSHPSHHESSDAQAQTLTEPCRPVQHEKVSQQQDNDNSGTESQTLTGPSTPGQSMSGTDERIGKVSEPLPRVQEPQHQILHNCSTQVQNHATLTEQIRCVNTSMAENIEPLQLSDQSEDPNQQDHSEGNEEQSIATIQHTEQLETGDLSSSNDAGSVTQPNTTSLHSSHLLATRSVSPTWQDKYCRIFDTNFQAVGILDRGKNKEMWRANLPALKDSSGTKSKNFCAFVLFSILLLVGLPSTAGAVVAYYTPPVGFSCRSLTFVMYGCLQTLATVCFCWLQFRSKPERTRVNRLVYCVYVFSAALSLFTGIGGTLMQVIGIYRNCICDTIVDVWIHDSHALIDVATDTSDQRYSSTNWIVMGLGATGFMVVCSYVGLVVPKDSQGSFDAYYRPHCTSSQGSLTC